MLSQVISAGGEEASSSSSVLTCFETVSAPANPGFDFSSSAYQGGREEQVSLFQAQGPRGTVCWVEYVQEVYLHL